MFGLGFLKKTGDESSGRVPKGDIDLIYWEFDEGLKGLYNNVGKIHVFPVLPERLLRRYIEDETQIQKLLKYRYVGAFVKYNPNQWKRIFLEEERKKANKTKQYSAGEISNYIKDLRLTWKNTANQRYLVKLDKFGNEEQIWRSYKNPIYIGTTEKIFYSKSKSNKGFFNFSQANPFLWNGTCPYLALDTKKSSFIKKMMRYGFKEILELLRQIKRNSDDMKGDIDNYDFDEGEQSNRYDCSKEVEKIIQILENPLQLVDEKEQNSADIDSIDDIDLDDDKDL